MVEDESVDETCDCDDDDVCLGCFLTDLSEILTILDIGFERGFITDGEYEDYLNIVKEDYRAYLGVDEPAE